MWDKSFPCPTLDKQGLSAWKMILSHFLLVYLFFSNTVCSRKQIQLNQLPAFLNLLFGFLFNKAPYSGVKRLQGYLSLIKKQS